MLEWLEIKVLQFQDMMKKDLLGFEPGELKEWLTANGEKSFREKQIFEWIYAKGESDVQKMTNLGVEFREK